MAKEWLGYRFDPTSASAAKVDAISEYETTAARIADPATTGSGAAAALSTEEDLARAACD